MDAKYLIAGICGYKIGIPMDYVLGAEIIRPSYDIKCYADDMKTVHFRGRDIIFIDLRKKLDDKNDSSNILIVLQHPFCILGISVDVIGGIVKLQETFPLPELIKKATSGLLENYGFIDKSLFFTLRVESLLSLEQYREFESGVAA